MQLVTRQPVTGSNHEKSAKILYVRVCAMCMHCEVGHGKFEFPKSRLGIRSQGILALGIWSQGISALEIRSQGIPALGIRSQGIPAIWDKVTRNTSSWDKVTRNTSS